MSASPDAARRFGLHDALIGNVAVAIIDEPTFVRKSAVLRECLRHRVASLFHAPAPASVSASSSSLSQTSGNLHMKSAENANAPEVRLTFLMGFDTLERFLAPRYYGSGTLESMHTALDSFFSQPPEGDGSKVVCAGRGSSVVKSIVSNAAVGQQQLEVGVQSESDENESDAVKKAREVMQLAKPFVDAGKIALTDLTDWEMQLSSSEVRSKCAAQDDKWRAMVHSSVYEYIENHHLYSQQVFAIEKV